MTWDEANPIVDAIPGFLVPGQEEYLFKKVQSLPEPALVVEVGCFKGRSTMAMAMAMVGTQKRLYTVDRETFFAKESFFGQEAARARVDFTEAYSNQTLCFYVDRCVNMIFIDGSHTMPNVLCDFAEAFRILKPGGWIVIHDYTEAFPDVIKAWDMFKDLFTDLEECHSIRAGRKAYVPHDTP